MRGVDAVRLGAMCRALRIKKGWRQVDLARRAQLSTATVWRLESGRTDELTVAAVITLVEALGGRVQFDVRWFGAELDRLLNARHSALHESVAHNFRGRGGWMIAPEVSFNVYGERGIIDIRAWHAETKTLLVIELKTDIVDVNELMGTVDRKRRLAPVVARDRGWEAATVAVWVIVGDSATNRRRVHAHGSTLRAAFPSDGRAVDGWLARPRGGLYCLSFWANRRDASANKGFANVRRVRPAKRDRAERGTRVGSAIREVGPT